MKYLCLFILASAMLAVAQPKALFYMTTDVNSVKSFTGHADKIDALVPAWYSVDGNGLVSGGPNPDVLQTAAKHHVPIMPIVALANQADLHKLFITPAARIAFINSLVSECRKYSYSGFQIDFENVNWTDRDLLSSLVPIPLPPFTRSACCSPLRPYPTLLALRERAAILIGFMQTGVEPTI